MSWRRVKGNAHVGRGNRTRDGGAIGGPEVFEVLMDTGVQGMRGG